MKFFLIFSVIFFVFSGCEKDSPTELPHVSDEAPYLMSWDDAVKYCEILQEKGSDNWRLPTISELRTLIRNCPYTEYPKPTSQEDWCEVTDECTSDEDCKGLICGSSDLGVTVCKPDKGGKYSVFEESGAFWSSTENPDYPEWKDRTSWLIMFLNAGLYSEPQYREHRVRCWLD